MGANGGVPSSNGRKFKSGNIKSADINNGLINTSSKGFEADLEKDLAKFQRLDKLRQRGAAEYYIQDTKELDAVIKRADAAAEQLKQETKINRQREYFKQWQTETPDVPDGISDLELQKQLSDRIKANKINAAENAIKEALNDYGNKGGGGRTSGTGGGTPSSSGGGRGGLGGSGISSTTGNSLGGVIKASGGVNAIAGTVGKVASTAWNTANAVGTGLQLVDAGKNTYNDGKNWIDRNSSNPLVKAKAWKDFYEKSSWITSLPPFNKWQADRIAKFKTNLQLKDPATYKALYSETSGDYVVAPPTYPFTGGQSIGVAYRINYQILRYSSYPSSAYIEYGERVIAGKILQLRADKTALIDSDSNGVPINWDWNFYIKFENWALGASGQVQESTTRIYRAVEVGNFSVERVDGQPDTGGNPPPTTPEITGTAGGIGVGSSVLNAGGYLKLKGSPSGTSVSLDGTPAPVPRSIPNEDFGAGTFGTPQGYVPDWVFGSGTPPPIDANGKYAPKVELTSGASSSGGAQYLPSPNLGDFGGGEIWYDKDGNVVTKETAAASRAGIGFESDRALTFVTDANGNTRLGVDPSGSTAKSPTSTSPPTTQPSGTTGTAVPKPEAPGAQPTPIPVPVTQPSTTPEATPKFDLTKTMIDEIALAVISVPAFIALKDFASKAFQNTEAIKNTPKSPCLAPVYVPPVGAEVKKNLIATNTLQGVTIAQGQVTQNAVNAVSTMVNTVNTKLGEQLVGGISGTLGRLFNSLGLDRWLNLINTALLIHNATMLSNNVLQTVGSVVDNILQLAGFQFKNAEGNQVSFGELVGLEFHQLLNTVLGAQNAATLLENLKKANRIYQAAANVLWSVQSLLDSARTLTEIAIENTGKIGNALRKAGAVFENAYRPMVEKATASSASQQQFDRIVNNLDDVERVFSTFEQITSEGVSIKDNLQQIKTDKKEFDDSIKAYKDGEKTKEDASKTASSTVDITKIHLVKPEETTP